MGTVLRSRGASFALATIIVLASLTTGCSFLKQGTVVFEGISMLPSIRNGEKLKIIRLDAESRGKLARGDVVAFRYPLDPSKGYIKRLIALPGERVEIIKGDVFVNGTKLVEPYLDSKFNLSKRSQAVMTIPRDAYYVLGDNRDNSSDSRIWGVVPKELVDAKVVSK